MPGLQVLTKLPQLKSLNLRRSTHMTDAGLAYVKALPNLEYLSLLYNNVSNAGLAELKGLKKLKLLDLRGCVQVSDAGLMEIKDLKNLKSLKLRNPALTDAGLAYLSGLTRLTSLSVEDAQITDCRAGGFGEAHQPGRPQRLPLLQRQRRLLRLDEKA